MIVRHSRHRVRRLNAMALTLRSGVAFTHECAEPGRSKNPGQQNSQENYRSCGSSGHFPKLYLRLLEMRKLVRAFPPSQQPFGRPNIVLENCNPSKTKHPKIRKTRFRANREKKKKRGGEEEKFKCRVNQISRY